MRASVTQERPYGCGIACFAFACELTYRQAEQFLGAEQAKSERFWLKDLVASLNRFGKATYASKHVRQGTKLAYTEGMIVLIRRSKSYPVGHYLIRHNGQWMDPWFNLPYDRNIHNARSGYRKRLPCQPMYTITPKAR